MSKNSNKHNDADVEPIPADDEAVSEDAVDSAENSTVQATQPGDQQPITVNADDAAQANLAGSEQSTYDFGDAGSAYIEGYLREELGLDGDLTDDEFALAALDFLGSDDDDDISFFAPDAALETADDDSALDVVVQPADEDDDAFAKSVEELEEEISSATDPTYQKEGTVTLSLPESVRAEVAALLNEVEAEEATLDPVSAETPAPTTNDPPNDAITPLAQPADSQDDAPAIDEAMRELLEIQALLETDPATEAPAPPATQVVADHMNDQASPIEMVAEEEAEQTLASEQPEQPVQTEVDSAESPTIAHSAPEAPVSTAQPAPENDLTEDAEEAAIVAMMAELEGVDLDSIDLDALDFNALSAEETITELTAMALDDSSSALDAALDQLDGLTNAQSAEEMVAIDADRYEETSDYLDTLVTALDEAVTDIGLSSSTTLALNGSGEKQTEEKEQLIVFTLGNADYGISIDNVIEVGEPIAPTVVPFVPRWVRGVINLRGEIISLIDLRDYFEIDENRASKEEWMIVAQNHDASIVVALIVDDVRGNRALGKADLAELKGDLNARSTTYLHRIYRQEEELIVALDFDKLLDSAEMRQFEPI